MFKTRILVPTIVLMLLAGCSLDQTSAKFGDTLSTNDFQQVTGNSNDQTATSKMDESSLEDNYSSEDASNSVDKLIEDKTQEIETSSNNSTEQTNQQLPRRVLQPISTFFCNWLNYEYVNDPKPIYTIVDKYSNIEDEYSDLPLDDVMNDFYVFDDGLDKFREQNLADIMKYQELNVLFSLADETTVQGKKSIETRSEEDIEQFAASHKKFLDYLHNLREEYEVYCY